MVEAKITYRAICADCKRKDFTVYNDWEYQAKIDEDFVDFDAFFSKLRSEGWQVLNDWDDYDAEVYCPDCKDSDDDGDDDEDDE